MKNATALLLPLLLIFSLNLDAQWTELCTGTTNGFVVKLQEYEGDVFVTGFIDEICSSTVNHVGRWNGGGWVPVGSGLPMDGHTLEELSDGFQLGLCIHSHDSGIRW